MFGYKTFLRAGAAVLLLSALLSCKKDDTSADNSGGRGSDSPQPAAPVSVNSVAVSPGTLVLAIGESAALTATVLPEDAGDKSLAWSSSDPSTASVDAEGNVSALALGEAVITVTTNDGSFSDNCSVTVSDIFNPDMPDFGDGGELKVITATIAGSPATRASYSDEDNVLKACWDAEEAITVITYTGNSAFTCDIATIDNFTYKGEAGKKTVDFTGKISEGATSNFIVFYPALVADGEDVWGTPVNPANGRAIKLERFGSGSSRYMLQTLNTYGMNQEADGSTGHLSEYAVMRGTGTVSGGRLAVTMNHLTSVIKLKVTFPEAGKLNRLVVSLRNANDETYAYNSASRWHYMYPENPRFSDSAAPTTLYLGGWNGSSPAGIEVPESRIMTFYWLFVVPTDEFWFGPNGGSRLNVVSYGNSTGVNGRNATLGISNNTKIEAGKVYRASVTLE